MAVSDDGAVRAGAPLAYLDNGDGTITDLNTGLMWEKKGSDGGLHDKDNPYAWSSAQDTIWDWLDQVNAEGGTGFAGHDDWRIPNIRELSSIVDYGTFGPAVSTAFDDQCTPGCSATTCSCTASFTWSGTTIAAHTALAWIVDFDSGLVFLSGKSGIGSVRAVRGGS